MSERTPVSLVYFGKLPSRGDFVRSANHAALTQTLDRWATGAVELMAQDVHWKQLYDQAACVHFAFLGVQSKFVLAGHMMPSVDASGRRFPFIAAGTFEVADPLAFIGQSPMALARLWVRFEQAAQSARQAEDATPVLAQMNQAQIDIDVGAGAYEANYADFLEMHTVGSLQDALRAQHPQTDVRRLLLGLGLLLQPVPASGNHSLEKGVRLPLPADPMLRPVVATFWLELISRFLERGAFEVALFVPQPQATLPQPPFLYIGFAGGSPHALQAVMDRRMNAELFVDLSAPTWVEDYVGNDYSVKKLASYLERPELSLSQSRTTFREVFLGL